MNVTIMLVGAFREGRFHEEVREYPPGTSVQGVIDSLGLPASLFGTALVNGVHAAVDATLHDGDALCLLPMIDGG